MRPDPVNFKGVAFGVISYDSAMDPQIDIRQAPFETALASIFLPELLKGYLEAQSFEPEDHTKIQFSFFGTTSPFQEKNKKLITYVVGASVENVVVKNLSEPVNIILQHINSTTVWYPVVSSCISVGSAALELIDCWQIEMLLLWTWG
uniref:adhesion G-protein coupled receptor G4-like isoform X1 n=1 Tax=Podarcis muralis TaxID=64176 RepID=UPI00109F69FB|nr:adhesion G-protein coupled receptor G4-like isoform X1 [Podarcis muralis]